MPASRARTAICSAPLECPSRPGLPTRIFTRRPSASLTRSTSSRSSSMSADEAPADASPTPVGARYSPKASRSVADHSPVVAPARHGLALLGLGGGVDHEDRVAALGPQPRRLGLRVAVEADHDLLAGLDALDALAMGV